MAQEKTEFTYHNIELYKSESLGSGSYGGVCKAKCDGLLCAAKIMHSTLFDPLNFGTESYLQRFKEEGYLLSLARHPNVVQYLATYYDPDTRLPVLLMELCDESLTAFLDRSPKSLSFHSQVNICHNITLALVYLHSNGLIHRDLTGSNVLMIAGTRAKITDFGMSKLATVNPRMTALTMCPGNVLYMSPEALNCKPYTAKLDIFSFGVIVIQILTRQFPNPTGHLCTAYVAEFDEEVQRVVPETKRREAHLKLIPDDHSLKPIALQCIESKENVRPTALQLSETFSELKQSSQYTESMLQTQSSSDNQQHILIETKTKELQEHRNRNRELQCIVESRDRQLREYQHAVADAAKLKERELQHTQEQLQASEKLVSEFQHSLLQKDKIITDLQETISAHAIKIHQLELEETANGDKPEHTQKDISKMRWRMGKNAPEEMSRGAAVSHGSTVYFMPGCSNKVYSHKNILGKEKWSQLPDNPNINCGLAVVNGLLTSVGGRLNNVYTNTLFSLTGEGMAKKWFEIFSPMPTPRQSVACVTTKEFLVVIGGLSGGGGLDIVEVMNMNTKQWTTVSSLPQKQYALSTAVCGDTLYLAGGFNVASKSVFSCPLPNLLPFKSLGSILRRSFSQSWKEISSLPVGDSTLVSFNGQMLAIGGRSDSKNYTTNIYRYDPLANVWNVISQMKNKRSHCLAVTLRDDQLIVVGGYSQDVEATDSVEILE